MMTFFMYCATALVAFAVIGPPLCRLAEDFFVHGSDGGHGRRFREYHDQARSMGLTYGEAADNLLVRESLARLRREASDKVAVDPGDWYALIQQTKAEVELWLKQQGRPDLARSFVTLANNVTYGDILYPEEAAMVGRLAHGHRPTVTHDQIAALKIVRPG